MATEKQIELGNRQVEEQHKNNVLLEEGNALKAKEIGWLKIIAERENTTLVSLVNDLPREDLPEKGVLSALPSKEILAKNWLVEHPEDMNLTGRELETNRLPMGVKISYVTWNKIKKELKQ